MSAEIVEPVGTTQKSADIILNTKFSHNEDNDEFINGTHLMGYISTTFWKLEELFGAPTFYASDPFQKVNCEWKLRRGGRIVTIYDWKMARIPESVYEWHIGGKRKEDIEEFLKDFPELSKYWKAKY